MMHTAKKHRSDDGCHPTVIFSQEDIGSQASDFSQQRNVALNGIIRLNVGGTIYMTTYRTLVSQEGSRLAVFFSQLFSNILHNSQGNLMNEGFINTTGDYNVVYPTVFIDRDGERFSYILNYLRDGEVVLPDDLGHRRALMLDARYFGLHMLETKIRMMIELNNDGMQTPRANQKDDATQPAYSLINVDRSQSTFDPSQMMGSAGYGTMPKRLGSMGSLPSTSAMGNPFEDSQSYFCSQKSYDEDGMGYQKSLLQVVDNDNIEDSGVFIQTTPLSRMGKTEFITNIEF